MHRAALITGASKRLGRAMALDLAKQGVSVAVHYSSSKSEAQATAKEIEALGVQACLVQADLLDQAETSSLVARASDGLGQQLDILINNASIFEYDNIHTATPDSWDRHIASNLRAPYQLSQDFCKQVPEQATDENDEPIARAAIINMIDQRVRKLTPEFSTYTIAKSGLWAMTQTLAQALAPYVRVNAIGPGPTMQGERQSERHFSHQRANTILQRGANPQDIVQTLNFLLNCPAVTGQLICVDGGQHLGWKTPDVQGVE